MKERDKIMAKEKEATKESVELEKREEAKPAPTPSPFRFMRHFADDMERLFEEFEGFRFPTLFGREIFPFGKEFERADWVPKIEVLHQNEQLIVRAELPGLSKDDVKVEITEDALTLSGERKEEKEEKREGYYRSERSYGSFYRRIPLPEGANVDNAAANFKNGMLEVTVQVPKAEPRKRTVEINEGEKAVSAKSGT
jgi:HSP20 family protein